MTFAEQVLADCVPEAGSVNPFKVLLLLLVPILLLVAWRLL